MSSQPATDHQAYQHYNQHYQNSTYAHIQHCVVKDITGKDFAGSWDVLKQEPMLSIHNTVIDAALNICGVSNYRYGLKSLLLKVVQHQLSDETLKAMATHLRLFTEQNDTLVDDFVATATTLKQTQVVLATLDHTLASVSQIHSTAGRGAYHLLSAVQSLTRSAEIVLTEGATGYCREKLASGIQHLQYAQQELDS